MCLALWFSFLELPAVQKIQYAWFKRRYRQIEFCVSVGRFSFNILSYSCYCLLIDDYWLAGCDRHLEFVADLRLYDLQVQFAHAADQMLDIQQENEQATVIAKLPVAEVIKGFSNEIRSLTQGKAIWYPEYSGYEKLPKDLQDKVVREIRKRKGVPEEPPKPQDFMD